MNPRIENLLQISADTSEDIRQQVPDMDAGFDDSDRTWEIIVKTAGSLDRIRSIYTNAEFTQLLCGYWIVRTTIDSIEALAAEPEIIFIEKPKALYFELYAAKSEACVNVAKAEERAEKKAASNAKKTTKREDAPAIQNQAASTTLGDIDALAALKEQLENKKK